MRFKLILYGCLLVGCSFTFQTSEIVRIIFPQKDCSVRTDGFGNIYLVNHDEITKYNASGLLQKKFSTKRYGKIGFVDATNPLKILVYFDDFQQLIFLDNQLTASSVPISLETIGYEQASLVCSSANNSFWLYNKQNSELVRFDSELKVLVKSGNLQQIFEMPIKPNFMKESSSYLYLNCPQEGILMFDIYGTFYKTIPLKNLKEFNVINGNIFYYEKGALKEYQPETFNTIEKPFADTLLKMVNWENKKFYKIYSDSLLVEE